MLSDTVPVDTLLRKFGESPASAFQQAKARHIARWVGDKERSSISGLITIEDYITLAFGRKFLFGTCTEMPRIGYNV